MNDAYARTNPTDAKRAGRPEGSDRLILLVLDDGYLWTVEEIGRELDAAGLAEDGVARLVGAGLLHRQGSFVWPTGRRGVLLSFAPARSERGPAPMGRDIGGGAGCWFYEERAREMLRLRTVEGLSLAVIGTRFGVSGSRARLIINAYVRETTGRPADAAALSREVAAIRRVRRLDAIISVLVEQRSSLTGSNGRRRAA